MSKINNVQQAIMQLEGGAFQKIFDAYLIKKHVLNNIQPLGVQTGTNKPTKGTPDSYVLNKDGTFTLICYGSVEKNSFSKIKSDILACFDEGKLKLKKGEISKIICGHLSTNLHIEQFKELMSLIEGVEIELIGIGTLSSDLVNYYPSLVHDFLGISIDTHQIFDINDFVKMCDRNKMNAPIGCEFRFREKELNDITNLIKENDNTVVMGPSGIGKTRLVLESCRRFQSESWQVLCVKSNSNSLFDDLRFSIEQPGNYLIFFDDANFVSNFEGILSYMSTLSVNHIVKVVLTVRDYARARVVETIAKFGKPALYTIGGFSDDEIKGILKQNLGIKEEAYLKQIANIAKGNIRLAMLAGIKFAENGIRAIKNAEDIFRNYYKEIFDKANLNKDELLLLAFIELAGPVMIDENQLFNALLSRYLPSIDKSGLLSKLSELEVIDWFKNEVAKTVDQSLGNFIIYYVFFDRRWLSFTEILKMCMPKYRDRVIYIINTALQLFYSDELKAYLERQIKDAWYSADPSVDESYLEVFYPIDPLKALCTIKNKVDQMDITTELIADDDFDKQKNNNRIQSKDIKVLTGYKYLDYYSEAVELLLLYYEKRPDLFMDFYFAITTFLMYDKYSVAADCEKEYKFLSELWVRCKDGNDWKFAILYIRVAEYALQTEFSYTEEGNNSRQVSFVRMALVPSNGVKRIRKAIWDNLFILRRHEQYLDLINHVLCKRHVNGLYEDATKEIVLFDFNCIYPFIDKNIDYTAAKIINAYKEDIRSLGLPDDERCLRTTENDEFRVFDLLSREYIPGLSYEEGQIRRKACIKAEIKEYSMADFESFFKVYHRVYKREQHEQWQLSSGISYIFESLEHDLKQYKDILKIYLKSGGRIVPYKMYRIVDFLLKNTSYIETKELISVVNTDAFIDWNYKLYECVDSNKVTEDVAKDFFDFLEEYHNVVPSPELLLKYSLFELDSISGITDRILGNNKALRAFLADAIDEKGIAALLTLYNDNIDCLCKMYVRALNYNIDYEGELFEKLYKRVPSIWKEYILWLKDNLSYDAYEQNIINVIWKTNEYSLRIGFAFDILTDDYWVMDNTIPTLLFNGHDKCIQRKKEWLMNSLKESIDNIEKCKKLIYMVVIAFPDWKLDYVMSFLELNKNIEDFKSLYLFSNFQSWSGSEIPLINKKIDFLTKLKDKLVGITYIEHRLYIEQCITDKEKYKEKVELREYIENAIYS